MFGITNEEHLVMHLKLMRTFCLMLTMLWLAGCGGGGDSAPGTFTLNKTQLNYSLSGFEFENPEQQITMSITGSKVSYAGAAYQEGTEVPSWLSMSISGSGSSYTVTAMIVNHRSLNPGNYSTTFLVGTVDDKGNILKTQPVTVNLHIKERVRFNNYVYSRDIVYGSEASQSTFNQRLTADATTSWQASTNRSWLKVLNSSGKGSAEITTSIDYTSLLPGIHDATLTVSDVALPMNSSTFKVQIRVSEPAFTISGTELLFGGVDGVHNQPQAVTISTNTGARAHPFTVSISTDDGISWLTTDKNDGLVGAAAQVIQFAANAKVVESGSYYGKAKVSVKIDAITLSQELKVKFNKEATRMSLSATGIALSQSPERSVLNRRVKVFSSLHRPDIPWTATSDSSWLTVTRAGKAGEYIELTANPTGLTTDQVHFANVRVSSSDPIVENHEEIRVGLTLMNKEPTTQNITFESPEIGQLVVSPVEPLVFMRHGNDIKAYNVYSGAEVRSFNQVVNALNGLTISGDGRYLFLQDSGKMYNQVVQVDAETGREVYRFFAETDLMGSMYYARPDGIPMLLSLNTLHNLDTRRTIPTSILKPVVSGYLSGAEDPSWIVDQDGLVFKLRYTALDGGEMTSPIMFTPLRIKDAPDGSYRAVQSCVNADSTMVYTAAPDSADFLGVSLKSAKVEQNLIGLQSGRSMLCGWNGLIIGGADTFEEDRSAADIFVFNGKSGALLTNFRSSPIHSEARMRHGGMVLSADGTQLISISDYYTRQYVKFARLPSM
jgi:hypothetical protein